MAADLTIFQEREEEAAAEEFDKVTGSLHHLLSTSVRPGIFRSPYGEAYSATAFDIPVEKHIEDSFKVWFQDILYHQDLYHLHQFVTPNSPTLVST